LSKYITPLTLKLFINTTKRTKKKEKTTNSPKKKKLLKARKNKNALAIKILSSPTL